jgi:hypothetical protein
MGGKLFNLGRLPRPDYLELEAEVKEYLDQKFSGMYRIPRYYGDKADFGDLDVLLSRRAVKSDWNDLRQEIITDWKVTNYILQPHLLSTAYQDRFQVDVFVVAEDCMQTTWQFLCYNDLGNLLGKIFRRFNLKYGEKGLFYVFRREDGLYKQDIPLCTDLRRILNFLEMDFETWDAGFEHLEDMFAWVVGCKYFSVSPFLNRANSTEKRMRERTTMRKFIEYLEKKNIAAQYPFAEDRDEYIPMIANYFPEAGLREAIDAEKEKERRHLVIRDKFNGRVIMQLFPELQGKDLGRFIEQFKLQFKDFENEILESSPKEILEMLKSFYVGYRKPLN